MSENKMVTQQEVGDFINSVAGTSRSPAAVAGRLIEEVVELALSAGLTTTAIMGHVTDSLHNQALKQSRSASHTVFPSELHGIPGELASESADVSIVLKDLCQVAGIDLQQAERKKWDEFIQKEFVVSRSGTVYAKKPHIINVS